MKQAILLSVQPRYVEMILNGLKTREVRTYIPKGFKGWVYLYVVMNKDYLFKIIINDEIENSINYEIYSKIDINRIKRRGIDILNGDLNNYELLNGLVVARFWFDEWEEFTHCKYSDDWKQQGFSFFEENYYCTERGEMIYLGSPLDYKKCCLSLEEIKKYSIKNIFTWHIKKLEIFEKPKELGEFYKHDNKNRNCIYGDCDKNCNSCVNNVVTRPPQSFMYCYVEEEK